MFIYHLEDHHFQSPDFSTFYLNFQNQCQNFEDQKTEKILPQQANFYALITAGNFINAWISAADIVLIILLWS